MKIVLNNLLFYTYIPLFFCAPFLVKSTCILQPPEIRRAWSEVKNFKEYLEIIVENLEKFEQDPCLITEKVIKNFILTQFREKGLEKCNIIDAYLETFTKICFSPLIAYFLFSTIKIGIENQLYKTIYDGCVLLKNIKPESAEYIVEQKKFLEELNKQLSLSIEKNKITAENIKFISSNHTQIMVNPLLDAVKEQEEDIIRLGHYILSINSFYTTHTSHEKSFRDCLYPIEFGFTTDYWREKFQKKSTILSDMVWASNVYNIFQEEQVENKEINASIQNYILTIKNFLNFTDCIEKSQNNQDHLTLTKHINRLLQYMMIFNSKAHFNGSLKNIKKQLEQFFEQQLIRLLFKIEAGEKSVKNEQTFWHFIKIYSQEILHQNDTVLLNFLRLVNKYRSELTNSDLRISKEIVNIINISLDNYNQTIQIELFSSLKNNKKNIMLLPNSHNKPTVTTVSPTITTAGKSIFENINHNDPKKESPKITENNVQTETVQTIDTTEQTKNQTANNNPIDSEQAKKTNNIAATVVARHDEQTNIQSVPIKTPEALVTKTTSQKPNLKNLTITENNAEKPATLTKKEGIDDPNILVANDIQVQHPINHNNTPSAEASQADPKKIPINVETVKILDANTIKPEGLDKTSNIVLEKIKTDPLINGAKNREENLKITEDNAEKPATLTKKEGIDDPNILVANDIQVQHPINHNNTPSAEASQTDPKIPVNVETAQILDTNIIKQEGLDKISNIVLEKIKTDPVINSTKKHSELFQKMSIIVFRSTVTITFLLMVYYYFLRKNSFINAHYPLIIKNSVSNTNSIIVS